MKQVTGVMISIIMPAKNASSFIREAVDSLRKVDSYSWELIVINDGSTDDTYNILKNYSEMDERIKVFHNIGTGKVQGLSYGYSLSKGNIIKCIDADDVLLPEFFDELDGAKEFDAHCHDSFVVNQDLRKLGAYHINASYLKNDFEVVLRLLISLPRWTWSFKRELADKIFPLPSDLPFEDVWFALIIKRFAKNIKYIDKKIYLYRQHDNQTFGGILNYQKGIINFRAKRIIRLVRALSSNRERLLLHDIEKLEYIEKYNLLLVENFNLSRILKSDLELIHKLKIILICYLPSIAATITKLKWNYDRLINT